MAGNVSSDDSIYPSGTTTKNLSTSAFGMQNPYAATVLGKGMALANTPYQSFMLPGGEGQADSARVANMNPMESNAYNALGNMSWQNPMNTGIGAISNATSSRWGADTSSPYMNAYNQAVGGGNAMYNQAMSGIGGLNFGPAMARGMGGTEAALNSSFNTAGNQYMDTARNAMGTSSMLNQAGSGISGMNAGNAMQSGMNTAVQAGQGTFSGQQNQYLDPMRQAVGTNAGLDKATQAFGGIDTADVMKQGMGMMTSAGATQFGEDESKKYMSPYQQQVVEQQKQNAMQDYARQLPGQSAAAFQAGAGRGTRAALLQAEGQRNLQNQLQDIQAKGSQSAFENAQNQFNTEQARKLTAGQSAVTAATDITGRSAQLGENALNRSQQQYDTAMAQYNADKARQATAGQNQFNMGSDIYGKQYQYGTDELARNRDIYNSAMNQYNTEIGNRLNASNQLFNQGSDIYNKQYQAGSTERQQQIDAYNRSMDQYNADMNRALTGGQQLYNVGSDLYGRNVQAGKDLRSAKQDELNAMYEDFIKEQNYPREQNNYMMQLLNQMPQYQDYTTTQQTSAPPQNTAAMNAAGIGGILNDLMKSYGSGSSGGSSSGNGIGDLISKGWNWLTGGNKSSGSGAAPAPYASGQDNTAYNEYGESNYG